MRVYVESNFVLELALRQEQAAVAEEILVRAERRQIELAFPSISLSEPFSTITHRARTRENLSTRFNEQVRDLLRSSMHQQDAAALEPIAGILAQVGEREMDLLVSTVNRLLVTGIVIQIDQAIFRNAIRYRNDFDFSEQDATIYASVLSHLAQSRSAGPHLFISRDKHFSDPKIASELGHHDCIFVPSFARGVELLDQVQVS